MSEKSSPKSRRRTNSKNERRSASFCNSSSPWFRRNSFLSPAMIQSENISIYESSSYYSDYSSYNIVSLKECQGFIFNQDLFASPFQQQKTLATERKLRAMSFSHKPKSRTASRSSSFSSDFKLNMQRRHTTCDTPKPNLKAAVLDTSAIIDDEDESIRDAFDQFDNTTIDIELSHDEDAVNDEYDETEGDNTYKVHVTEIVVNDNDDIYPS